MARWLLHVHDRIDGDVLPLTQETLAEFLGVRRTTVTHVVCKLRASGAIRSNRRSSIEIDPATARSGGLRVLRRSRAAESIGSSWRKRCRRPDKPGRRTIPARKLPCLPRQTKYTGAREPMEGSASGQETIEGSPSAGVRPSRRGACSGRSRRGGKGSNARAFSSEVDAGSHSNQACADCVDLSAVENASK